MGVIQASNVKYSVDKITVKDNESIIEFLKQFFYKDSPLSDCLQMTADDCAEEATELTLHCIRQGVSFKAIDLNNGKIIGIIINDLWHKSMAINRKNNGTAETLKNEKLKVMVTFREHIENQVNLFEIYPKCEYAMYINKLSVDASYRNLGIAQKLIEKTIELMNDLKLSVCQILVTNYYLVKLCLKMNFNIVHEIAFKNYVVNGVNPLLPAKPHNSAMIFIKIM